MDIKKIHPALWVLVGSLIFWLSWPPMPFWFLLFIVMVPVLMLNRRFEGSRFGGWKFFGWVYMLFLGWNLATTWWLFNVSVFGAVFANLVNPLIMTIPVLLFRITKRNAGDKWGYFAFILYWISYEYFHMNWELSWPWLVFGNGLAKFPVFAQWYEFTGHLGGSLWFLTVNILVYDILFIMKTERRKAFLWLVLLIVIPSTYSILRYLTYEEKGDKTEVVILQPNIDPFTEKFASGDKFIPFDKQVSRFLELTRSQVTPNTDFIVWPETTIDIMFNEDRIKNYAILDPVFSYIDSLGHVKLITGIPSYKTYEPPVLPRAARFKEGIGYYEIYNTALWVEAGNHDFYHKSKLVPGAEIMPYAWALKFLNNYVLDLGGTTGGFGMQKDREVFFDEDSVGIAPSICYESIYGDFMSKFVSNGANFIFIITNDGWWGNTPGHRQHLYYASLRAIENRRSIARSANTGISAFINQRGDIISPTKYWEQDAIRGEIRSNSQLTIYSKAGDYIARTVSWLSVLILIAAFVKKKVAP